MSGGPMSPTESPSRPAGGGAATSEPPSATAPPPLRDGAGSPSPSHEPTGPETCANCGTRLLGEWCHGCGQRRRDSARLHLREVVARFCENLLDFDSAVLRTFVGLTTRPGNLCREYVEGRRKRSMSPFGYFLLAAAVNVLASGLVSRLFGEPAAAGNEELPAEASTWLMLALLVPLAATWRRLFRRGDLNLAENYVFALYVLGQFVWFELLIFLPLTYLVSEPAFWTAFAVGWVGYVFFAALGFYRESWWMTAMKVLASAVALTVLMLMLGTSIAFVEWLVAADAVR